ncbi:MAG TPA: MBL fold metallo-hydrolase [Pirellulales bacterium]|jgi:competence protein ComEC|nr:MBL fold metallo-hydrolase [Pirellulales bacterium]
MTPLTRTTVGLLVLGLGVVAQPAIAGPLDKHLDIYWIDVEGGAATLIVTPAGQSVLIDTGNPGHRDPDRIVQVVTRDAGLRQLDHVIITHYHADHFGGAATLATMLPIRHLHDNGEFEGLVDRPDQSYLDCKALKRSVLSAGDVIELEAAPGESGLPAVIRCLGARQTFVDPPASAAKNPACESFEAKPRDPTDNANSIVTLLSFGPFTFFDAGDLTWNLEKELVCPMNRVGHVEVYQAGHHGMDVSNSALLIRALEPRVAIINNGATKGCDPRTLTTLEQLPSMQAVYQVHRNVRGDGSPNTDDARIANAERDCKGAFIKLSVEPGGKRYTVHVPSTGHSKTFETRQAK